MSKNILSVLIITGLLSTLAIPVKADYLYDRSGTLVKLSGSILGDDDDEHSEVEREVETEDEDNHESTSSPSPASTPIATDTEKKREEELREQAKQQLEKQIESRKKLNEKREVKSKLEIKSEDGKFKLKQETKDQNGRETHQEVELKDDESLFIEDSNGERTEMKPSVMELKTNDDGSREAKLELVKNKIRSKTNLNLAVDQSNNLIYTNQEGQSKQLTILPDDAATIFKDKGIETAGESPELIENESGEAVYRITQDSEKKILGFALKFKRQNEVSAETGEIVSTSAETNPLKRFLDRLLF